MFSVQEEPTLPASDQLTTSDEPLEITLTELNEKEIQQSQEESKRTSSGGVVKRRRLSRSDKEKVQQAMLLFTKCTVSLSLSRSLVWPLFDSLGSSWKVHVYFVIMC